MPITNYVLMRQGICIFMFGLPFPISPLFVTSCVHQCALFLCCLSKGSICPTSVVRQISVSTCSSSTTASVYLCVLSAGISNSWKHCIHHAPTDRIINSCMIVTVLNPSGCSLWFPPPDHPAPMFVLPFDWQPAQFTDNGDFNQDIIEHQLPTCRFTCGGGGTMVIGAQLNTSIGRYKSIPPTKYYVLLCETHINTHTHTTHTRIYTHMYTHTTKISGWV
jgi:hypothetical protein